MREGLKSYEDIVRAHKRGLELHYKGRTLVIRSYTADFLLCRDIKETDEVAGTVCIEGAEEIALVEMGLAFSTRAAAGRGRG